MSDFLLLPLQQPFLQEPAVRLVTYIRVHVGTLPASTHIFVSLLALRLRVGVTLDWLDGSLGPLIGDLVISRLLLRLYGTPGYIVRCCVVSHVVLFGMYGI